MGLVKRAADLAFTFRFIRMLTMDWKNWDAYKEGLIDENGERKKGVKLDTDAKKSAYTPFIRLCANVKRLVGKLPGGGSKLGSFASALYLIKEKYQLTDYDIDAIIAKVNVDAFDFLNESSEWFLLDNRQLSPGMYRLYESKLLNKSFDELVWAKDQIKVEDECFPVGDVFGIDIYEVTHTKTNQKIFITANEIYK